MKNRESWSRFSRLRSSLRRSSLSQASPRRLLSLKLIRYVKVPLPLRMMLFSVNRKSNEKLSESVLRVTRSPIVGKKTKLNTDIITGADLPLQEMITRKKR
jgi:hypothetical protein